MLPNHKLSMEAILAGTTTQPFPPRDRTAIQARLRLIAGRGLDLSPAGESGPEETLERGFLLLQSPLLQGAFLLVNIAAGTGVQPRRSRIFTFYSDLGTDEWIPLWPHAGPGQALEVVANMYGYAGKARGNRLLPPVARQHSLLAGAPTTKVIRDAIMASCADRPSFRDSARERGKAELEGALAGGHPTGSRTIVFLTAPGNPQDENCRDPEKHQ